jgi:nucleoside-diphosphate-sugar epimerase
MNVLITGGAGFIGSTVAARLRFRQYHEVQTYDNLSTGRMENLDYSIPLVVEDILNYEELEDVFTSFRPDAVVHLAAQAAISTSWDDPHKDAGINITGTLNVIRLCKKMNARMIFSSTSAVYDEDQETMSEDSRLFPTSPYGISKLAAERYVATLLPESVILRFGNVYGPKQVPIGENQVIPLMIQHFEQGKDFFIHGDGNQRRDFVFVDDVALAVDRALTGAPGIYNIASGVSVSINELAAQMADIYDVPQYPWPHDERHDPRWNVVLDVRAAGEGLDWSPMTSLAAGLAQTVEWWKHRK